MATNGEAVTSPLFTPLSGVAKYHWGYSSTGKNQQLPISRSGARRHPVELKPQRGKPDISEISEMGGREPAPALTVPPSRSRRHAPSLRDALLVV